MGLTVCISTKGLAYNSVHDQCNNHLLVPVGRVYRSRNVSSQIISRRFGSRSSIMGAIESIKQHTCSNQLYSQQLVQFKFVVYITIYPTVWLIISVFPLVVGYRVKSDQTTINNYHIHYAGQM
jgi:hypothetical protein